MFTPRDFVAGFHPSREDYLEFKYTYGRPGKDYHQPEYIGTIFESMTFGQFIDGWDKMVKIARKNKDTGLWVRAVQQPGMKICLGDYSSYGTYEREMLRDYFRKTLGLSAIGFF